MNQEEENELVEGLRYLQELEAAILPRKLYSMGPDLIIVDEDLGPIIRFGLGTEDLEIRISQRVYEECQAHTILEIIMLVETILTILQGTDPN